MTDLSKVLPTKSATVQQIENYWKQRGSSETPRGYLGASAIGKECARSLWYEFRKCSRPDFDGRLYRLFNRGHREEATFVEELRGIGCEVHEFDAAGNHSNSSLATVLSTVTQSLLPRAFRNNKDSASFGNENGVGKVICQDAKGRRREG